MTERTHNGSVFNAEVRQGVGGAHVNGSEWGAHDTEKESQIRPLVRHGGGT